jgi:hypothetical protein
MWRSLCRKARRCTGVNGVDGVVGNGLVPRSKCALSASVLRAAVPLVSTRPNTQVPLDLRQDDGPQVSALSERCRSESLTAGHRTGVIVGGRPRVSVRMMRRGAGCELSQMTAAPRGNTRR